MRQMWRGHMLCQFSAQNEQRWNINALQGKQSCLYSRNWQRNNKGAKTISPPAAWWTGPLLSHFNIVRTHELKDFCSVRCGQMSMRLKAENVFPCHSLSPMLCRFVTYTSSQTYVALLKPTIKNRDNAYIPTSILPLTMSRSRCPRKKCKGKQGAIFIPDVRSQLPPTHSMEVTLAQSQGSYITERPKKSLPRAHS